MGTSMRAVFKYYNYYGTTFMHPHAASYTQYTKAACNVLGSKTKSAWSRTTATLHACMCSDFSNIPLVVNAKCKDRANFEF